MLRTLVNPGNTHLLIAMAACIACCAGAAATPIGDTVVVSQDGTWGAAADCPPTFCSAPGDTWSWSFEIDTNPVAFNVDPDNDFEASITNFVFSENGSVIGSLSDTQTEVTFFSTANCGGLATDDDSTINECSDQLYAGSESSPTIQAGSYAALLTPQTGGCGGAPFEPCSTATFGDIVITPQPDQTPEPSTAFLMIVPLLSGAFVIRQAKPGCSNRP